MTDAPIIFVFTFDSVWALVGFWFLASLIFAGLLALLGLALKGRA